MHELAVAGRLNKSKRMDLPPGQKKSGRCRKVAVVGRWPLVEVRL